MSQYLVPTDETTVELVARAIARSRLHRDASNALENMIGLPLDASDKLEVSFERVFEMLWAGDSEVDNAQKASYRDDALAAIAAINLKLITS